MTNETNETKENKLTFEKLPGGITRVIYPERGIFLIDTNQVLGKGKDGKVYKAYHLTKSCAGEEIISREFYAIKVISSRKSIFSTQEIEPSEATILREKVSSKTLSARLNNNLYYFMEYADSNLHKLLNSSMSLFLLECFNLTCGIIDSVNIISHHTAATGQAVFHGDLKPDNILVKTKIVNGQKIFDVRITDFFNAKILKDESSVISFKNIPVVPEYAPPEMLNLVDTGQNFINLQQGSVKSDIYSLSVIISDIFYDMLNQFTFPKELNGLTDQLKIMLKIMRESDSRLRPNISQVMKFFNCLYKLVKAVYLINANPTIQDEKVKSLIPDIKITTSRNTQIFSKNIDDFVNQANLNIENYIIQHEDFFNSNNHQHSAITRSSISSEVEKDLNDKKDAILKVCAYLRAYQGKSDGILNLKKFISNLNFIHFKTKNDFNGLSLQKLLEIYNTLDNETIKMAKERTGFFRSTWSNSTLFGMKIARETEEENLYTKLANANSIKRFSASAS